MKTQGKQTMGEVAKSIDQGTKGMNGFGNAVKGVLMKLGPYGAAAAAAFSLIGAAISVAWSQFKRFAQEAKAVRDGARGAKMSTREYAELSYVAQRTGVSLDAMVSAVQRVSEAIEKAKKGNREYIKFYDTLGLSIAHLDKMSPAEKLAAIAEAANSLNLDIANLPSAKDVLGQENIDEIKTLQKYNVDSIIAQGEQLGELITPEMISSVRKFQSATSSAANQFMMTIMQMKAFSEAVEWSTKKLQEMKKNGETPPGKLNWTEAQAEVAKQYVMENKQMLDPNDTYEAYLEDAKKRGVKNPMSEADFYVSKAKEIFRQDGQLQWEITARNA